jgi:nucleotide-binding universal stress UspA family protein
MFRKILVAFDGSPQARKAFDVGLEIARRFGAELEAMAVIRLPEPAVRVELDAALEEGRRVFAERFGELAAAAAAAGVTLQSRLEVGHPAEQIVHAAERDAADLIVMGRRGVSRFERWMLGSISERVLRYAHCPVLVVH